MALSKEYRITVKGKKFKDDMKKLAGLEVAIGFQHGTQNGDVDICDIAAWNELGTERGIPSRPFLRNSIERHEDEINQFLGAMAKQLHAGQNAETLLKGLGVFHRGLIQEEITDGEYAPNAESTIRKKGSDHPLIDTGLMRESVQFQVRKRRQK